MTNDHSSNRLEIYWARQKLWKLFLFIVVCLGALYYLERTFTVELIVITALALIGFPILLVRSSDKRPCIIINDEGLFDRRLKMGVIPWSDIKALTVTDVHGTKCIGFQFYDEHKYSSQTHWFNRLCASIVRMPTINMTASGTEIGFDDLYRLISDRHARFNIH